MLNAPFSIIRRPAHVCKDTQEIRWQRVTNHHHSVRFTNKKSRIFTHFTKLIFIWRFFVIFKAIEMINPCVPSPCGQYSQCREINGHAVCSCLTRYIGSPPNCRPECVVSSECDQNMACQNEKCIDPCPGTCGVNARCTVINHNPICSCSPGFTGDPFNRCIKQECKLFLTLSKQIYYFLHAHTILWCKNFYCK